MSTVIRKTSHEKPINPSHRQSPMQDQKPGIKREADGGSDDNNNINKKGGGESSEEQLPDSHLREIGPFTLLGEICAERPIKRPRPNDRDLQKNLHGYPHMRNLPALEGVKMIAGIVNQAEHELHKIQSSAATSNSTSKSQKASKSKGAGQSNDSKSEEKAKQKLRETVEMSSKLSWLEDPTDKYCQHAGQVEDEMTQDKVRIGFKNFQMQNESQSAMGHVKIDLQKMGADLLDIKAQRYFQSCILDTSSKTVKNSKNSTESLKNYTYTVHQPAMTRGEQDKIAYFFSSLADSTEFKKILKRHKLPDFRYTPKYKFNEAFIRLANYEVPISRAIWYLKALSFANIGAQNDQAKTELKNTGVQVAMTGLNNMPSELPAKTKKSRNNASQPQDGCLEWTRIITEAIQEISVKLLDINTPNDSMMQNGSKGFPESVQTGSNSGDNFIPNTDTPGYDPIHIPQIIGKEYYRKYWEYLSRLACAMFAENLLDRNEFLNKVVTMFDLAVPDIKKQETQPGGVFGGVKLFLPLMLAYIDPICKSHFAARKLAFSVSRYISMVYSEEACQKNSSLKYNSVVIGLSALIQCVTLAAPSALVWYPEFTGVGMGQRVKR